jgi:hypothetical protein
MYKVILLVVVLCAVSCTRQAVPVVVAGQAPTTELEKMGAVKMEVPQLPKVTQVTVQAIVVKPTSTHTKTKRLKTDAEKAAFDAEQTALDKAGMNFLRAACLNWAVDRKIAYDIQTGAIHDFGNVLTMPVCADFKV